MNRKGFTLVEIMIVVLIIGLLAAIAIPSFLKARENTRTNACINNLRQIDAAKQQWAMEYKMLGTDTPTAGIGPLGCGEYIKGVFPVCPSAAAIYVINAVDVNPTCSSGIALHVLPL